MQAKQNTHRLHIITLSLFINLWTLHEFQMYSNLCRSNSIVMDLFIFMFSFIYIFLSLFFLLLSLHRSISNPIYLNLPTKKIYKHKSACFLVGFGEANERIENYQNPQKCRKTTIIYWKCCWWAIAMLESMRLWPAWKMHRRRVHFVVVVVIVRVEICVILHCHFTFASYADKNKNAIHFP